MIDYLIDFWFTWDGTLLYTSISIYLLGCVDFLSTSSCNDFHEICFVDDFNLLLLPSI